MNHTPQNLTQNLADAAELLRTSHKILLTTHERTDGDDLGTVLALKIALEKLGKDCEVKIKGGVPEYLEFLPHAKLVSDIFAINGQYNLLVVSGCSNFERTGLSRTQTQTRQQFNILNIDHHPDNEFYGTVNLVEPTAAAVAEVAYDLIKTLGVSMDQTIAQCLLTGIISDTGSFVHSNTTSKTLRIAGELFGLGARPGKITKHTFSSKDPKSLKAWGKALASTTIDYQKQMALCILTANDLRQLGDPPMSVFEGLVETINKIPEVKFALLIKQDGSMVKGSLRSDPHKRGGGVDVAQLAKKYGGGGHKYAAGFSIPGNLIKGPENNWKILPYSPA